MGQRKPVAVFVKEDHIRWRLELGDLAAIRKTLGVKLLTAYCAASVHAERLQSLIDVTYLCKMNYRNETAGAEEHLEALSTFGARTLSDLLASLLMLLEEATTGGVFEHSETAWARLDAFVRQWEHDPFYRRWQLAAQRDEVAAIERGLSEIETQGATVLCRGRGSIFQQCSGTLARHALNRGSASTSSEVNGFLIALSEHRSLATTVCETLILALKAKGVTVKELAEQDTPQVGEPV